MEQKIIARIDELRVIAEKLQGQPLGQSERIRTINAVISELSKLLPPA